MGKIALCVKTKDYLETKSLSNQTFELVDRDICETDDSYLQLIPYVVIVNSSNGDIFIYKRGTSGNEDRLHDLYSIGVGGHVETTGDDIYTVLKECAVREIEEEIGYVCDEAEEEQIYNQLTNFSLNIYDDSNDVGKHHLGICFPFYASDDKLKSLSMEDNVITNTQWKSSKDLELDIMDNIIILETWSIHAFNNFFKQSKQILVNL